MRAWVLITIKVYLFHWFNKKLRALFSYIDRESIKEKLRWCVNQILDRGSNSFIVLFSLWLHVLLVHQHTCNFRNHWNVCSNSIRNSCSNCIQHAKFHAWNVLFWSLLGPGGKICLSATLNKQVLFVKQRFHPLQSSARNHWHCGGTAIHNGPNTTFVSWKGGAVPTVHFSKVTILELCMALRWCK